MFMTLGGSNVVFVVNKCGFTKLSCVSLMFCSWYHRAGLCHDIAFIVAVITQPVFVATVITDMITELPAVSPNRVLFTGFAFPSQKSPHVQSPAV